MPAKDLILDFSDYDLDHVEADQETIRSYNPQRHEMEQLTAVVYEDGERNVFAGYKDVSDDEFWIRGHMPGMPLMPGVVMCEAAAQLCAYFAQKYGLAGTAMVGLGALEDVRFRGVVRPGDRLVLTGEVIKFRTAAMIIFHFQGFVERQLVVEGRMKGIPLPVEEMLAEQDGRGGAQ